MNELKFPKSPCDICTSRFERYGEGLVISGPFNYYFIVQSKMRGEEWFSSLSEERRNFVNGVTREYFLQFPEWYAFNEKSEIDNRIDMNAPKYRLSKVISID